jgi:pyruvate dehydrogenase E2 component (dihydrolipoamide acetyltransferase)
MAIPILMPKLSFVVTQGTIIEWLKGPGDAVSKGEPLLTVESEKAVVDVEAPGSGILGPELAPKGTTVPVTTIIGYILKSGEAAPKLDLQPLQAGAPGAPDEAIQSTTKQPEKEDRARVSPVARKLALELGVDLNTVVGTGPQGRITKEDVERAAGQPTEEPVAEPAGSVREPPIHLPAGLTIEPMELTTIQRVAAERMAHSFRTAPHFYLSVEIDMSQAAEMRQALLPGLEAKTGVRLSYTDILICAASRALSEHPSLNAALEGDQLSHFREINPCLAVDTPRGLTVPVFHAADQLTLAQIAHRRQDLVKRAQNNRLTPEDVSQGTFTISNLGMFGIDLFQAIINPPQAAILAAGRIAKRPIVVQDRLELRPTIWLTLSVDHRAADGAAAARFLQDLKRLLTDPYTLLI